MAFTEKPLDKTVDTCNNSGMSKDKPKPILTNVLKTAIKQSGLTYYRIAKITGLDEANLGRFMRAEISIRLDKADLLAEYLGLRLVANPKAKPPQPTPDNLARPMLSKRKAKKPA